MTRTERTGRGAYSTLAAALLTLSVAGLAKAQTPEQGGGRMGEMSGSSVPINISTAASSENQSPFFGSVSSGKATGEVLQLSIEDAFRRGLRYNLALLLDEQTTRGARGQRWKALSDLLPNVTTRTSETAEQLNLEVFGFSPAALAAFHAPAIVGPFSYFDTRAFLSQPVFNLKALENARASEENIRAAEYSYKDARDLVLLVVGNAYLLVNAAEARVETAQAQVKTSQSLYQKAADMRQAGLTPAIDELRAKVELQARQQQLIAAQNQFAKRKLDLARAIGLAEGQQFVATDRIPFRPLAPSTLERALERAFASRSDYQAALARVRAAQRARKAAAAERLPTLAFNGDYGDIGLSPGASHGTFTAVGTLTIPVFQGGKVRGDILLADAALRQRESELADLRGRIDYQVRSALLDLDSAADQVAVAKSSVELANQTLEQAQDRFAAGVTDNIEVVQAQEAVAGANEAYISSVYAHNVAKANLARAEGIAEQAVIQYLKVR
ncbi:MAG TPA: TolC family protein [Terriglobia bacterium]|nr:TolC family protein [Terriglobia bacterium]